LVLLVSHERSRSLSPAPNAFCLDTDNSSENPTVFVDSADCGSVKFRIYKTFASTSLFLTVARWSKPTDFIFNAGEGGRFKQLVYWGYNCYLPTLHSSCAQLESLCYFGKDHQSHNTWLSSHLRNHVPATFVTTRQVTMSAEALQTLQTAAITLACLSGLFGEPHRSATTRQLNTKLLLINRHIYRTCCACDMGDVSACHGFIEETEMGHYRLVCACGVAVLCVSSSCVDSWISLPILLHALFNSRVHDT
jgi:hypothetical protein